MSSAMDLMFYAQPGPLTWLNDAQIKLVRALGTHPTDLCRAVQGLLTLPETADGSGLSAERLAERNTRPATAILSRALELDNSDLAAARSDSKRVVGTCRHFAILSTAFLRATGIPARARCGFACYFQPPKKLDHWTTEYWSPTEARWIRIDSEVLDLGVVRHAENLAPREFLTGGEAWELVRSGAADSREFGVWGTENWGPAEIRGNALRDLASLVKLEMLPWDDWGPMQASYQGRTGADFDRQIDELAALCRGEDLAAIQRVYEAFAVPKELIM